MTKFIPGDVVKTAWGKAVIAEAHAIIKGHSVNWHEADGSALAAYSASHLPGHIPYIWKDGMGMPSKCAWYSDDELEMVAPSAARGHLESVA